MDVATVCGSAANVGLTRIFSHDLVRLARNVDAFNYYRIPRPDIKVHFDALLYPIDKIESRLAAIAIAQNSPEVLSALRASASLTNSSCDQLHRTLREQARTATSDPAHTLASLLQDSTREENISISTECSDSSPPLVSATVAASGAENNVDDADRVKNELDASGEDSHVLDLLKNYVPPVLYLTISSQFVFERYLYSKRKPRRWR
ncbi:uncharacterized protein LOC108676400 [Hyalella azteca]|uniref:Uncharacterized protein LOC108676400 n=1 Tax=Hyalella azteca TaxID=294128 RepID=A0A8B7P1J7_HYAAZ|nr:uncharacterized protein LOC108676400 [Hyalella azteca]